MKTSRQVKVNNKELLAEIVKSKLTYCWFQKAEYAEYDELADDLAAIDYSRRGRIYRHYTLRHIPLDPTAKYSGERYLHVDHQGPHKPVNFPAFQHLRVGNGRGMEVVGKSHHTRRDRYSLTGGRITSRLAEIWWEMIEGVARMGWYEYGHWHVDDWKGEVFLHMMTNGLKFDESKSANAFSYTTSIISHAFHRQFELFDRQRQLKDNLAVEYNIPSFRLELDMEMRRQGLDK